MRNPEKRYSPLKLTKKDQSDGIDYFSSGSEMDLQDNCCSKSEESDQQRAETSKSEKVEENKNHPSNIREIIGILNSSQISVNQKLTLRNILVYKTIFCRHIGSCYQNSTKKIFRRFLSGMVLNLAFKLLLS